MTLPSPRTFTTSLLNALPRHEAATTETKNPLSQLPPHQRLPLLTLHVLYPNELLPALDLLDRELVTRFRLVSSRPSSASSVRDPGGTTNTGSGGTDSATTDPVTALDREGKPAGASLAAKTETVQRTKPVLNPPAAVYHVRSAQQQPGSAHSRRFRDPVGSATHYQVHTTSWSCSCPAFAFAAFPAAVASVRETQCDAAVRWKTLETEGDGVHRVTGDDTKKNDEWMAGGLSLGENVPLCKHLLACLLVERTGLFAGFVKEKDVTLEEMAGWAAGWGG